MLLIHGADDDLVPMQSSELFSEAAEEAGLDVRSGGTARGIPHGHQKPQPGR